MKNAFTKLKDVLVDLPNLSIFLFSATKSLVRLFDCPMANWRCQNFDYNFHHFVIRTLFLNIPPKGSSSVKNKFYATGIKILCQPRGYVVIGDSIWQSECQASPSTDEQKMRTPHFGQHVFRVVFLQGDN